VSWHVATVVGGRPLTGTARALTLSVPGFTGALPGQHVDLRLTAPDGYQATRAYSLAEAGHDERVDLVVDEVPDGEVSPYLVRDARPGDQLEVRGPLGGYFVWHDDDPGPVLLVAGGSGVVPFLAMLRARREAGQRTGRRAPFRLVCSVRTPADAIEREEIDTTDPGLEVRWVYTRQAPPGWPAPPRRITTDDLTAPGFAPEDGTSVFVCGPTAFVEAAAGLLTGLGHPPARVRTERFGGA
jgi:ferredoxin-NADP reductase